MSQEQSPRLSHVGLYVNDVPKMIDFYASGS
jgi:catechol 2,3-dioxygenase-like lactoylglutathione lyase family enzyme